jgi:heme-degrading monooxygenase HmoA
MKSVWRWPEMVARVTLAEVDVVRSSLSDLVEFYKQSVMPAQRAQDGYEGGYALTTPEGKALVMTFWRDEEAAEAGMTGGFYGEQVEKFVTVFKAPPGREMYDVAVADVPSVVR